MTTGKDKKTGFIWKHRWIRIIGFILALEEFSWFNPGFKVQDQRCQVTCYRSHRKLMTELGLELTSQFSVSIFSRQDIRYRENYLLVEDEKWSFGGEGFFRATGIQTFVLFSWVSYRFLCIQLRCWKNWYNKIKCCLLNIQSVSASFYICRCGLFYTLVIDVGYCLGEIWFSLNPKCCSYKVGEGELCVCVWERESRWNKWSNEEF